jgi:hypothetical protein
MTAVSWLSRNALDANKNPLRAKAGLGVDANWCIIQVAKSLERKKLSYD